MLKLFRRSKNRATIERLYGTIVAQARREAFYTDFAVPDNFDGRFELVVLHTVLVCRRLKRDDDLARALSQDIFDAFLADMDATLREIGVGDLTVPKRMKKIGEAFYGRAAAYDAALAAGAGQGEGEAPAGEDALAAAIARNILGQVEADGAARGKPLAAYVRTAAGVLDTIQLARIARGEIRFPEPVPVRAE